MNLQEALAQRQQNTENKFLTGLLQFGLRSSPQFDFSGDSPVYTGGSTKMPDKTALWNQYVQIKKGRLGPQDLAQFEEYYRNAKASHQQNQLKGLNELALKGYSDKKIKKLVKDSPDLYNNLMDMVSSFEGRGDEAGMAAGAQIREFLPSTEKGLLFKEDKSGIERVLPVAAAYGAYQGGRALMAKDPKTNIRQYKALQKKYPKISKYGKHPATIAAYMAAEPLGRALGGEEGGQYARKALNLGMVGYGLGTAGKALMGKGAHGSVAGAALIGAGGLLDLIWGE